MNHRYRLQASFDHIVCYVMCFEDLVSNIVKSATGCGSPGLTRICCADDDRVLSFPGIGGIVVPGVKNSPSEPFLNQIDEKELRLECHHDCLLTEPGNFGITGT